MPVEVNFGFSEYGTSDSASASTTTTEAIAVATAASSSSVSNNCVSSSETKGRSGVDSPVIGCITDSVKTSSATDSGTGAEAVDECSSEGPLGQSEETKEAEEAKASDNSIVEPPIWSDGPDAVVGGAIPLIAVPITSVDDKATGAEPSSVTSGAFDADSEEIIADEDDTANGAAPVISPDSAGDPDMEGADALN